MKKIFLLLTGSVFASGCAAMVTPHGEIYTELLAPTSTVVVEETVVSPVVSPVVVPAPRPVIVSNPRPIITPAPRPVVVSRPRPFNPGKINAHPDRYAKNSGPKGKPFGKGNLGFQPGGGGGSHNSHGPRGR